MSAVSNLRGSNFVGLRRNDAPPFLRCCRAEEFREEVEEEAAEEGESGEGRRSLSLAPYGSVRWEMLVKCGQHQGNSEG